MSNLHIISIITGLTIVYGWFLLIADRIDWLKSDRRFMLKKALDCVVNSSSYLLLVFATYAAQFGTQQKAQGVIILECIVLSIASLYLFTKQLVSFSKSSFPLNRKAFLMILISLLIGILASLSTVNYAIYTIWPSFYDIPAGLTFGEIAFEFIYYMFTLAITYSGSSIQAAHVVTKIIQILEVCYCYIFIGNVIVQLIELVRNEKVAKK